MSHGSKLLIRAFYIGTIWSADYGAVRGLNRDSIKYT